MVVMAMCDGDACWCQGQPQHHGPRVSLRSTEGVGVLLVVLVVLVMVLVVLVLVMCVANGDVC